MQEFQVITSRTHLSAIWTYEDLPRATGFAIHEPAGVDLARMHCSDNEFCNHRVSVDPPAHGSQGYQADNHLKCVRMYRSEAAEEVTYEIGCAAFANGFCKFWGKSVGRYATHEVSSDDESGSVDEGSGGNGGASRNCRAKAKAKAKSKASPKPKAKGKASPKPKAKGKASPKPKAKGKARRKPKAKGK